MTHTPGPWEVKNGCNVFAPAVRIPLTKNDYIACTGGLSGTDTIERDAANARLIAAAPDLLEAVQKLLPLAAKSFGALTVDLDAARAAVAKATGGAA